MVVHVLLVVREHRLSVDVLSDEDEQRECSVEDADVAVACSGCYQRVLCVCEHDEQDASDKRKQREVSGQREVYVVEHTVRSNEQQR